MRRLLSVMPSRMPAPTPEPTEVRPGPVFVIGAPHSGTTALAWSLGQHPALEVLHGESWMAGLCRSLAGVEAEGRRVDHTRSTIKSIGQLTQAEVDTAQFWRCFGTGVEAVIATGRPPAGTNTSSSTGPRVGWTSADAELDRLVHPLSLMFPGASWIHVVRSPGAAIDRMCTAGRPNPRPWSLEAAQNRWVEAVGNGLDAEAALGPAVLRLEYEAMATEPEAALSRCFGHLGLDFDPRCTRPLAGGLASDAATPTLAATLRHPAVASLLGRLALARQAGCSGDGRDRLVETFHRHSGIDGARTPPRAVRRCRALVESSIPAGSVAAVVSRGDDALLEVSGVTAMHFPRTPDGVYAGHHPGSSAEAVDHLLALQDRGVDHLVLPASSFWWLDYYRGLRDHLAEHAHVVAFEAGAGAVFALRSPPEGLVVVDIGCSPATAAAARPPGPGSGHREVAAELARMFISATDHFLVWGDGERVTVPEGWPVHPVGRWLLAAHPRLPVREIRDRDGGSLGWMAGHPLGDAVESQWAGVRLDVAGGAGREAFEDALYRLSGRWVAVAGPAGQARLHLDAGGTLAAVHATDREVAASTTSLLQAVLEGPGFARPGIDDYPADRENQFFPAGLTHLDGVRRLLPNHCLDLGSWSVSRHWPQSEFDRVDDLGLVGRVHTISSDIAATLRGMAASVDLHLGLTSGRDSRVLLACCRGLAGDVSTFTFDYGVDHPGSGQDVAGARELARIAGVAHQVIPVVEPSRQDKEDYLLRIGHAGHWGKARDFGALGHHRKPGAALVPGFLGGLGRGHYWPGMAKKRASLGAESLLSRLRLPASDQRLRAMGSWLDGVPAGVGARTLLDLLYLEHRGGAWAAAHLYGASPFAAVVVPFASRRVLSAMFSLPPTYRSRKQLYDDVIRITWPELLAPPFQAYPGSAS